LPDSYLHILSNLTKAVAALGLFLVLTGTWMNFHVPRETCEAEITMRLRKSRRLFVAGWILVALVWSAGALYANYTMHD